MIAAMVKSEQSAAAPLFGCFRNFSSGPSRRSSGTDEPNAQEIEFGTIGH